MSMIAQGRENNSNEGRPYRSHLQPACIPCRARKSRCKTQTGLSSCVMCQAHGTECTFPPVLDKPRRPRGQPRRNTAPRGARSATQSQGPTTHVGILPSISPRPLHDPYFNYPTTPEEQYAPGNDAYSDDSTPASPAIGQANHPILPLADFVAKAEQGSSTVLSPAIADDDRVFQDYLSNSGYGEGQRMVRFYLNSSNPSTSARPIVFNTIPRRGTREEFSRSNSASRCKIIENLVAPHQNDLVDLFFEKINMAFPIFDEHQFRRIYANHKETISGALLSSLYGNTMVFWRTSPKLKHIPPPELYRVWIQAENALNAELISTAGISTILTLILCLCGRPSTHPLGNGGFLGQGLAYANAFGLNRDPSGWNLSPVEKKFRIRIWRLLLIWDRWQVADNSGLARALTICRCSLAYGTPPIIHDNQHDVPLLVAEDLYQPGASSNRIFAARCFVALTTLTEVLGHCLEHIYHLDKGPSTRPTTSPFMLENLLTQWEDTLDVDIRRLVIRGTGLTGIGAANLRLAYLSVKLAIRRSQLDYDRVILHINDVDSLYYVQTRKVAEEIVDFVRELEEIHCQDFWLPLNAYTLTSATTFLVRCALTCKDLIGNPSLRLARAMIDALRLLRHNYAWDVADNCLSNCSDLVEKIEAAWETSNSSTLEFEESMFMDMDVTAMNGLFSDYAGNF